MIDSCEVKVEAERVSRCGLLGRVRNREPLGLGRDDADPVAIIQID
jgi:hypothetical protein